MVSFLEIHGLEQYPTQVLRCLCHFAPFRCGHRFYALFSSCWVTANFLSLSSECSSAWRSKMVEIGGVGRRETMLGGTLGYNLCVSVMDSKSCNHLCL